MSYLQHFGLKHDPLGKNTRHIVSTPQANHLTQQLSWLLQTKGIGLITGEAGTGKTCVLREWTKTLNPMTHHVIYQSDNHFKVFDLYSQLADSLGLERYTRYSTLWRALKQELLHLVDDKQITPIWILDEAHLAPANFFAELPAFLNFSFDTRDVITIILVGLPPLHTQLKKPLYSPLYSRLRCQFEWESIDELSDFQSLLTEALQQAGIHQSIISSSGMQLLYMASKGRLRVAHQLLVNAFQCATEQQLNHLPDLVIQHAIDNVR